MKLYLDRDTCIGCGLCNEICEKTFGMKEGKAFLKREICEKVDCEKEAITSCPSNSIKLSR